MEADRHNVHAYTATILKRVYWLSIPDTSVEQKQCRGSGLEHGIHVSLTPNTLDLMLVTANGEEWREG
jgi:hypothetical protein